LAHVHVVFYTYVILSFTHRQRKKDDKLLFHIFRQETFSMLI